MAQSIKIDFNVWSQFDHHAYEVMTKDFVHDHLFKVNANILSQKGKIRLQQTFKQTDNKLGTTGQTNVLFPLVNNKWIYFQYRPKGFRVHFDNGLINNNHLQHNLYASFQSNRKLNDQLFKVGCETIAQQWRINLRYRYSTQNKDHTLYSRWRYDYKNWTFEGIKAFALNNSVLLKNNLLFGYYSGNKTFHLRVENEGWRSAPLNFKNLQLSDIWNHATFNYTNTLSANQRIGLQTGIKSTGQVKPLSVVWEGYDPIAHTTLKLKASSDSSAALSLRNKIGTYGSYVLGVGIHGIGSQNKFNFGVQFDLNL